MFKLAGALGVKASKLIVDAEKLIASDDLHR